MDDKAKFYKGEDWESKGDAFKPGKVPHIGDAYQCHCGFKVRVVSVMQRRGEVLDLLVECAKCQQSYLAVVPKAHMKGGDL